MSAQGMDRETVERVAAWLDEQGAGTQGWALRVYALTRLPDPGPQPRSISHWGMFE